ncbi:hypothetical protein JJQ59_38245 (plasmid) [Cupriavidus necator]|uniref:Uncharacterized protein n=1 Tax=Cupriavidus necator TaxID=106590 RepID=A0A367PB03_CUPNE|nr:hypothetical protein JJQ59_38245 [Cupriavidus necator]RCJ05039.1 hypothetical protein DDK22_28515 [Cupriavidus necator]
MAPAGRRWNVSGNDNSESTGGAVLARLTSLRHEIRRASRRANALAACAGRLGSEAYRAALAEVFDDWMINSIGQQQLVCFASAAELGILLEQHVDRCFATAMQSEGQLLRVLYWAVMRRWDFYRRLRAGDGQCLPVQADLVAGASPNPQALCADCARLSEDPRRGTGHSRLYALSAASRRHYSSHLAVLRCEHRCSTGGARWVMSCHAGDPFVGWTLRCGSTRQASQPGMHVVA